MKGYHCLQPQTYLMALQVRCRPQPRQAPPPPARTVNNYATFNDIAKASLLRSARHSTSHNAMSDPYTSHSTGKLKLKGVKDGKVSKKKKSSATKPPKQQADTAAEDKDTSVVLRHLEDEDAQISRSDTQPEQDGVARTSPRKAGEDDQRRVEGEGDSEARKTDAERRWEEQRKRRLEERLRREGVKSHKERVQELNRYLSGLSEHHDMPKIGPG